MSLARDLDRLDRSALNHLRLGMLGVVLRAVELLEGHEEAIAQHPFLAEYLGDLARVTNGVIPNSAHWRAALAVWVKGHEQLPLVRLKSAGLEDLAADILLTLGFAEEDARLAAMFGDSERLTLAALVGMCSLGEDELQGRTVASEVVRLSSFEMIALHHGDCPRHAWQYGVTPAIWDALSGTCRLPPGMTLTPVQSLPDADAFVPPREDMIAVPAIAAILREHHPILCLRGPMRNGRHMLAGCVAKALGRPLLAIDSGALAEPAAWAVAGTLACITGAAIVVELALGPGEDRILPPFPFGDPVLIVVAGNRGGLQSADRRPLVAVEMPAPDVGARRALWQRVPGVPAPAAEELSERFRLTSGNLVKAAEAASIRACPIDPGHVQTAVRALHDARLEAVARRVDPVGAREFIFLDDIASDELEGLAIRCRHREALDREETATGTAGVRALFAGPSGTGKTIAARWLGRRLGKDMFRLDLAAAVSKYIGETEKVLDRAFAAAEDLDCILLIDEGDALMARRTDVGSANDRYANLETNFLLQRIEDFDGILIVTTNAAERIDKAFGRRMDVVIHFRSPDEVRRYEILDRHLGAHEASDRLLQEIACRCALTGGQLRNVAQHARLLALDARTGVGDEQLCAALQREYRKIDAHCPLKPHLAATG